MKLGAAQGEKFSMLNRTPKTIASARIVSIISRSSRKSKSREKRKLSQSLAPHDHASTEQIQASHENIYILPTQVLEDVNSKNLCR